MATFLLAALALFPAQTADLKASAIPLKTVDPKADLADLKALEPYIKSPSLIAMGEATHGTREFFQMKHRMFRYLAENHGFTVFGLEASMAACIAMDDYVLHGKGKPEDAVHEQGFWTWDTQEVLDLIKWMREYNKKNPDKPQLRVYGFDMQSAVDAAMYFSELESELKIPTKSYVWSYFEEMTEEQKADATARINEIVSQLEKAGRKDEALRARCIERTLWQAQFNSLGDKVTALRMSAVPTMPVTFPDAAKLLAELPDLSEASKAGLKFVDDHKAKLVDLEGPNKTDLIKFFGVSIAAFKADSEKLTEPQKQRIAKQAELLELLKLAAELGPNLNMDYRDRAMAENVLFAQETWFKDQKIFLWAHNGHISLNVAGGTMPAMGWTLNKARGKDYFSIGFVFGEGSFRARSVQGKMTTFKVGKGEAGTVDEEFSKFGMPFFFIPTDAMTKEQPMRSIGALFNPPYAQNFVMKAVPAQTFSALIYFGKTSESRALRH